MYVPGRTKLNYLFYRLLLDISLVPLLNILGLAQDNMGKGGPIKSRIAYEFSSL